MKVTLSIILDLFFFCFIGFLLSIIWLRYFLSSTFLIIFIALIISAFIGILFILLKYKKNKQVLLSAKEKNEFLLFKKDFLTNTKQEVLKKLSNIFLLRKNTANLYSTFSVYNFSIANNFFYEQNVLFTFYLDSLILHDYNLKTLLQKIKKKQISSLKKIFILCNSYNESCIEFAKLFNFEIEFITLNDFYTKVVNGLNLYNYNIEVKKRKKINIKNYFNIFFKKENFKTFIFSGLTIFLASLIVRYNIYYIIFATALLLLSLICKLKKEKEII